MRRRANRLGTALKPTPLGPAKARYLSAVIRGLGVVSLMAALADGPQRKVKGDFTTPWPLTLFGWLATAAMAARGS